ncbi:hypothetical protein DFH11DRAFT_938569 [Phellopilus nigrolimitatus]|nr:hypothetical protein DFH11DRAFT_938569 [Phellopilus nigrolimitatus]
MSGTYSDVGKTRLKAYVVLYVVNIVVLALSARVNQFQDFFYMADIFPLGLSITTLVLLTITLLLDFILHNSFTARPPFEIGLLAILSIFWLAFNAFSTSRWKHVPLACSTIPDEFVGWCRDLQALKSFVWIEWAILLLTTLFTTRYVVREHIGGSKHVWHTALSRYIRRSEGGMHRRSSSFFTRFENPPASTGAGMQTAASTSFVSMHARN